jgi:hypothetical protein
MRRKKMIAAVVSAVFILAPLQLSAQQTYKPGDKYDPNRFADPDGFQAKIQFYEKLYNAQLERERQAKAKSY